jgi:hypothetical protein
MNRIGFVILTALLAATTTVSWAQTGGGSDYHVSGGVSLMWRAPGDDRNIGTAAAYDLRYSTNPITAANFVTAAKAVSVPFPTVAGSTQGCFVDRLLPNTVYYFAIKAVDETGNWSAMSQVMVKTPQIYNVGDVNSDNKMDVGDIITLINYVFNNGREPLPWGAGDCNCDGFVGVGDVIYLLNHVFQSGPMPGSNCP